MNTMVEGERCLYPRPCHLHEVSISYSNTEIAPGPLLRPLPLIFTHATKILYSQSLRLHKYFNRTNIFTTDRYDENRYSRTIRSVPDQCLSAKAYINGVLFPWIFERVSINLIYDNRY